MSPAARSIVAVLVAVIAAYTALGLAATIDRSFGYPRSGSGVSGEVFLRLTTLVPFLVAAAVLGVVAAWIARPVRPRPWLLVVGILGVGLYAAAQRYVAPEWLIWLETIIAAGMVGGTAALAFWLIARRTQRRQT
ncbi:MAG TPA: hypothetical protein VFP80_11310 [Thermoanaerobaculia bacterium]|nr:hypothetical protein [Thermoanaerobaculia bacterium]